MKSIGSLLVGILLVLILVGLSVFTVDQRQNALVFRLGEIVAIQKEPGLHFKLPLFDNVRLFDVRILTFDTPDAERFITSEKKNVLVDYFVKWRVIDVRQYYISVNGSEIQAQARLLQTINDGLRAEFGKRTVHDAISGARDKIMEIQLQRADADARKIGVQVLDVRLKRVELPSEVAESVYRRMDAERKRVANELRSLGFAESERIRADADRQREVIIAEAYSKAQTLKGQGDAQASAVYADAFGQNPEFYSFYRSLEAYRQSFKGKNDLLVVDPNSDFFKYFKGGTRSGK